MSQFRLRTNPHNSPLQRPPIPQSLSSLISLPSSTKKGSISKELGFSTKKFESIKDIMDKDDILFSRRDNSSPQKSSSRGGGGKNHLNIPSRTSENIKFSKRSSISTPKYNLSTRAGTLTSIASSTKFKNPQQPQSIQNLSTKMSNNKARVSPFEMSTKSSTTKSLMEIENRKIILKLDAASIEGDIATEREEFLRKFAIDSSPKRSISPSVDGHGDSDTSSEPNLTERIRNVKEDSLIYKSGEDEEEEMPQPSKKETARDTACRTQQHNERKCRCVRHGANTENSLKQMKSEGAIKPSKPSTNTTLLIKKRRTSTTKNSKGTKHIGFSHQVKTISQLENQLQFTDTILTPKAEQKPKIFISLNEIAQETPIENSPQAASSTSEIGFKGVFSRKLDGMRIKTDVTEDAPTTISVMTPKNKTESRKEDEDSAAKMNLIKRMKSEPQHIKIHQTLEITEELDEISVRKTTQEDKNLNNFSTASIIKSRLNLTEESDVDVSATTAKNHNKGAGAKSSLNFKGLVELRRKEDLQEWVKLRRKTNKLNDDDKEVWNGNIKVIEEIRRRNIWEETPKAKENEETGFEIFKQGPGNFFEWNTENKFVQKHNILGNLQENVMASRQRNLNDTNETIQTDSSKEYQRLRVAQRNTEQDPSPMMVRYYDEFNPLTIQPKYMESTGSMCVTELWGNKTKTSYYKHMRKPLQNSTLLSLTPGAGVYRPEKGMDSHTLKNKRIMNGAIENELITSIESPHCFDSKKAYPVSKKARHTRAFVLQPSEKVKNNQPFRNISSKLGL